MVHGDQRFAYARPVRAGDQLAAVCDGRGVMVRGGNEFLTTRTEITPTTGELVVTVWTKLVVRG